jgi:hypothetical protein
MTNAQVPAKPDTERFPATTLESRVFLGKTAVFIRHWELGFP